MLPYLGNVGADCIFRRFTEGFRAQITDKGELYQYGKVSDGSFRKVGGFCCNFRTPRRSRCVDWHHACVNGLGPDGTGEYCLPKTGGGLLLSLNGVGVQCGHNDLFVQEKGSPC